VSGLVILGGRVDERGTSTLEFAVVLPLLLFIMLGTVEASRAWLTLHVATSAAREGARAGVVATTNATQTATDTARAMLGAVCSSDPTCSVTAQCTTGGAVGPCTTNSELSVTVRLTFTSVVPRLLPMLNNLALQERARMRYEGGT
jgi:Flp pilus assembly protein TadG